MSETSPTTPPPSMEKATSSAILLVEDDPSLARALSRHLAKLGLEVVHAPDGVVAADALMSKAFDLVLSDISLPGASGVDLLRLVRVYDLDVPVILMTGNPTLETATQAVELGAIQYLVKPVPTDTLSAAVKRGLSLGGIARARREGAAMVADGSRFIGDRAGLVVAFDRALESLRLVFQPIVDRSAHNVVAYEVLLRASEPSLPTPVAVIDAAERLSAVHHVGQRVRSLAKEALKKLPSRDQLLFVNLHAAELADPELYDDEAPLSEHSNRIVFEITERASLEPFTDAAKRIQRLRSAGFRIAIDDLGAGYAGLTTFTTLEPDFVKLDMSLIRDIGQSVTKRRVVQSVVHLCRDLSMRVVAEGIETRDELVCVSELGCDFLQGYYFGRPADAPLPA